MAVVSAGWRQPSLSSAGRRHGSEVQAIEQQRSGSIMTGVDLSGINQEPPCLGGRCKDLGQLCSRSEPSAYGSVDCVAIQAALASANRVCQHRLSTSLTTAQMGRVLEF